MRSDVAVLGAGIVGICVALHLQKRGREVVLLDRRGAAEETSFGNAGLIQREGVYPYGFPHDFGALLRYSFNRTIDAYYHPTALPKLAPFLWQYWKYSRPARHHEVARHYSKLIEHCVGEHEALAAEAGAMGFLHASGWIKVFRTARERDRRFEEAERWKREFGINYRALDARTLREMEPHVAPVLVGGRRRPMIGVVTMDQLLVDCGPDADVAVGDEAVLLGAAGAEVVTADEWADLLGTISYEIVTGLGPRSPRQYVTRR